MRDSALPSYDLIITGAGPGGSAAAFHASRLGLRVLLLDRSEFPRDKTCGDGLTPRAVHELESMGLRERLAPLAHTVRRVQVVSPGGFSTSVEISSRGRFPDHAWVIPRLDLDELIRNRAVEAGAEFAAPVHVTSIEPLEDGVRVRGRSRQGDVSFHGAVAIAATGAAMPLLRKIGLLRDTPDVIRAVRGYYEVDRSLGETWAFHFDQVPLPGYGWVFPVSDSLANIGLGYWPGGRRKSQVSTMRALEAFLASPGIRSAYGPVRPVGAPRGYPLRTDFVSAATHGRRVLLVGEAAGLVNPVTGEGIDYALESGRLAAEFLAASGLNAELMGYDALLRSRFQSVFKYSERLRRLCMGATCLELLALMAERREDLKRLLASILLGTVAVPDRVPPWKVLRVLAGR